MRTYSIRRLAAMAGGIACIAAETVLNISHVYLPAAAWWLQPAVIAIGVAGIAQAIAASTAAAAFREWRWIVGLVTLTGLVAAITFSFTTSYLRIAETAQERRLERDGRLNSGKRALAGRVAALQSAEQTECKVVGPECRKIRGQLVEARAALAGTGGDVTDVNILGPLAIVPELALPLMLLLLGLSLIAYAEAPSPQETRQTSYPADEDLPDPGIFAPLPDETEARTAKVRDFAAEYRARHGREPSVRTIAKATRIPPTSVHRAKRRAAG